MNLCENKRVASNLANSVQLGIQLEHREKAGHRPLASLYDLRITDNQSNGGAMMMLPIYHAR
jgi:hypothetical protein